MRICVFCSSAEGLAAPYVQAAEDIGHEIGARGHNLVFGGFETGLMGSVARAARQMGARVIGVLPCKAGAIPGKPVFASDEAIETQDIGQRKLVMEVLADAYVALPGAFGTLDELYDILGADKLMGANRPVALFNVNGFFDPLLQLHQRMVDEGMIAPRLLERCPAFQDVNSLMSWLESSVAVD